MHQITDQNLEVVDEGTYLMRSDDDDQELCAKIKHKLKKVKRKLKKSEQRNKELEKEIHKLKKESKQRKRSSKTEQKACQTDDTQGSQYGSYPMSGLQFSSVYSTATECQAVSLANTAKNDADTPEPLSIVDELRHAAEEAVQSHGYEFDEATNLYFDHKTGYYYNPENQLYYDSSTGIYYSFNEETCQYDIHSQVDLTQYTEYYKHQERKQRREERRLKHNKREMREKEKRQVKRSRQPSISMSDDEEKLCDEKQHAVSDIEDGELDSDSLSIDDIDDNDIRQELTWRPPCIRMIVRTSDLLTPGALYLITVDGGSIGREVGIKSVLTIPDPLISKEHCKFMYSEIERCYYIHDSASNNGTFINDNRLSKSKEECAVRLSHRDCLRLGATELLIHIHPGTDTCDDCEPGIVTSRLEKEKQSISQQIEAPKSKAEKDKARRHELKTIKRKYGLEKERYIEQSVSLNPAYEDKAEMRRKVKGSDNPYVADEAPSSVDKALSTTNIGHKLLQKMGWNDGETLGKSQQGIAEPVQVGIRLNANAGLGSAGDTKMSMDAGAQLPKARTRTAIIMKTQQRFNRAVEGNIFDLEEDEEVAVDQNV